MSCCCKNLCLCKPKVNDWQKDVPTTDECPLVLKVVASINASTLTTTDGSIYDTSRGLNVRPGESIYVDCRNSISGIKRPNRPGPVKQIPDDILIKTGSPSAGSSQLPAHIESGTDLTVFPTLHATSKIMTTASQLTGITGLQLNQNLSANNILDSDHRYRIDKNLRRAYRLISPQKYIFKHYHPMTYFGDKYEFNESLSDTQWTGLMLFPAPRVFTKTTFVDIGHVPDKSPPGLPFSYDNPNWALYPPGTVLTFYGRAGAVTKLDMLTVKDVDILSGLIIRVPTYADVYFVTEEASIFNLNNGTITSTPKVETFIESTRAAFAPRFFFFEALRTSTGMLDTFFGSGFYYKKYVTSILNPFPIPEIYIVPVSSDLGMPFYGPDMCIWEASPAEIASGLDVEANFLPELYKLLPTGVLASDALYSFEHDGPLPQKHWEYDAIYDSYFFNDNPPLFSHIPGAWSISSSWPPFIREPLMYPEPPPSTTNYIFKSETYPAGDFTIYPYSRPDSATTPMDNITEFKAKVSGFTGYILDKYGNDKMRGFTYFNYGTNDQDVCLILIPWNNDHLIVYESNGSSFKRVVVNVSDIPHFDMASLGSPISGYGAFGHYNERNNLGLIKFTTGQIRFGAYDPYNDNSANRWLDFGVERPLSKVDYDNYVSTGLGAGKTLYQLVPPSLNPNTIIYPKDWIATTTSISTKRAVSTTPSALMASSMEIKNATGVWIPDSPNLVKISKQRYIQNSGWVDNTDDKTGLVGEYKITFNLSSLNQYNGLVLMGRYQGDLSGLEIYVVGGAEVRYYPVYNGEWDYPVSYGVDPAPINPEQYRGWACAIDNPTGSTLVIRIKCRDLLTQMFVWAQ